MAPDVKHQKWWGWGADGVPEVVPPRHVDPTRTPRRHQRFRNPRLRQ